MQKLENVLGMKHALEDTQEERETIAVKRLYIFAIFTIYSSVTVLFNILHVILPPGNSREKLTTKLFIFITKLITSYVQGIENTFSFHFHFFSFSFY